MSRAPFAAHSYPPQKKNLSILPSPRRVRPKSLTPSYFEAFVDYSCPRRIHYHNSHALCSRPISFSSSNGRTLVSGCLTCFSVTSTLSSRRNHASGRKIHERVNDQQPGGGARNR